MAAVADPGCGGLTYIPGRQSCSFLQGSVWTLAPVGALPLQRRLRKAGEQIQPLAPAAAFGILGLVGFVSLLLIAFPASSFAPPRCSDWPEGLGRVRWGAVDQAATCASTPLVLCGLSESSSGL